MIISIYLWIVNELNWQAPVKANLLFPCTEESLGAQYNPLNVSVNVRGSGTSDQYPVGDLSSKFGKLTGFDEIHATLNDTNLPLYGATSVVGRSFVLNRDSDNERSLNLISYFIYLSFFFFLIHCFIVKFSYYKII